MRASGSPDTCTAAASPSATPRVVPLTGDASDRRYFRVLLPDAPSIVLSLHSAPFEFATLPFVNVARLLAQMPVPIPEVLGHADDLGVLALEDLGDVTLQAHLGAATPAEHAALYRQSVALIATLQRRGAELESPEYLPYGIAFDVEKLTWEMDFFIKHFLEAYRGVLLSDEARQALRREFGGLVQTLAGGAARALPSRLPQPQPDAARRASCTSSTSRTPAWGPTPTTSCRCCATPTWTCRSRRSTS